MINLRFNIMIHGNDSIEQKCTDMLDMPELNRQLMQQLGMLISLACRFSEADNAHISGFTVEKQPEIFETIYDTQIVQPTDPANLPLEDSQDDR
jgi:hypothetical protein